MLGFAPVFKKESKFLYFCFFIPEAGMKPSIKIFFCIMVVCATVPAYSQSRDSLKALTINSGTNLIYRIQLATVKDKARVSAILKRYGIIGEPILEADSTSVKVMIGSYPNYSSVKKRVDELKSKGLKGAFVVPYYKGTRITLQEAAMHAQE